MRCKPLPQLFGNNQSAVCSAFRRCRKHRLENAPAVPRSNPKVKGVKLVWFPLLSVPEGCFVCWVPAGSSAGCAEKKGPGRDGFYATFLSQGSGSNF